MRTSVLFGAACTLSLLMSAAAPTPSLAGEFGERMSRNVAAKSFRGEIAPRIGHRMAVHFDFNSVTLDAKTRKDLRAQARWMIEKDTLSFSVEGHTDRVGNEQYNKALGLRRANAVLNYLVSQGVDRKRLEAVLSKGETRVVVRTDEAERENRRVVIKVKGLLPALFASAPDATGPVRSDRRGSNRGTSVASVVGGSGANASTGGAAASGGATGASSSGAAASSDASGGGATGGSSSGGTSGESSGASSDGPGKGHGNGGGKGMNAGRGNGSERGHDGAEQDPGNSGGRNRGGD